MDAAVAGVIATVVDGRAFPPFSVLFGYGVGQLVRRHQDAGAPWRTVSRLVRRRGAWMLVIGFLHCLLLYMGDIVAAYGLLALVLVGAVRWREWVLLPPPGPGDGVRRAGGGVAGARAAGGGGAPRAVPARDHGARRRLLEEPACGPILS
ncbi:hypothetical protein [Pseudonocardia zijingensis]|uniref:DUF418 domain-containing protein n=1 Tax=Pseudonocardia zijingensis TaxID=153376 RepID=A0ABN1NE01_9PSEU